MATRVMVPVGYEAPLVIALPIIAAVVILKIVASTVRGRSALGGTVTVRCTRGHLFTTTWSALGSIMSVRLGSARIQRCPVGGHWGVVRAVNDADLTDEERRQLAQYRG